MDLGDEQRKRVLSAAYRQYMLNQVAVVKSLRDYGENNRE